MNIYKTSIKYIIKIQNLLYSVYDIRTMNCSYMIIKEHVPEIDTIRKKYLLLGVIVVKNTV